jgi:hypothetical protein
MAIGSVRLAIALAAGIALAPLTAQAQLAVSANDNKAFLDNGVAKTVPNAPPDTVAVIDMSASPPSASPSLIFSFSSTLPVFSRDGSFALVTRDNDHKISVLSITGDKVEYTKRDINAGLRPYQADIAGPGDVAIVANIGLGQGDADTISVIDLKAKPARVVNTVTVGQTPEGLKISPDGQHVAVTVMNGSNKPKELPFFNDNGLVKIFRVSGHNLTQVAEAPVGHWCQGAAWSKDSKSLLVQCMVEKEITAFKFDGAKLLEKTGSIKVNGGAAGIRTAEP